jgi:sugar lactone lactonase YvrE
MSTVPEVPDSRRPDRLALGEGGRWVDGRLVLVDILTGRLFEAPQEAAAPLRTIAELPVPLGAVAPLDVTAGTWIAAAGTGVGLIGPGGDVGWLQMPDKLDPDTTRMNDGTADPAGRFWAGSMRYDNAPDTGSLYRVDPDGRIVRALDGMTIPNGPAFDGDGTTMYLADTAKGVVRRYPVDLATGELGAPEAFITIPPGEGGPDGMTVDRDGCVWIALWGGGAVRRYHPDGTLDRTLRVPAGQPTSVCLGGADGRTLHITSAAIGLDPAGPQDGAVFTVRVDVPGLPTARFLPYQDLRR